MPLLIGEIIKPIAAALAVPATLSDAWHAVIGDRITVYRLNNMMKLQPKIFENARKYGLSLNTAKIPDRYAFSWFEEATKQDEEEIQELFARLLAQAAAGNEDAADRRHIEVIGRLTPDDAVALDYVFKRLAADREKAHEETKLFPGGPHHHIGTVEFDMYELFKAIQDRLKRDAVLAIDHLVVVGILSRSRRETGIGGPGKPAVYVNAMGVSLFEALGGIRA